MSADPVNWDLRRSHSLNPLRVLAMNSIERFYAGPWGIVAFITILAIGLLAGYLANN